MSGVTVLRFSETLRSREERKHLLVAMLYSQSVHDPFLDLTTSGTESWPPLNFLVWGSRMNLLMYFSVNPDRHLVSISLIVFHS